jgi:diaminohydroxyphosphoribosylaminopyrimidine deaminase/5-amino-6-(5-phosphoribosylamino)uracil reductase
VILDGRLTINPGARVCIQRSAAPTLVVATEKNGQAEKRRLLERQGVEVFCLPGEQGRVRLFPLLEELGRRGVKHLLIEGGGQVAATALSEGAVDKVLFFYGPMLLGGESRPMIGPLAIDRVAAGIKLHTIELHRLGDDVLVSGYVGEKGRKHASIGVSS